MRMNSQLINRSDLLSAIIEIIETSCAEDISLLICYGSYLTGNYGRVSDIDFFFVPKTERGFELGHQFILNDIGYDLWPVSWERLKDLSNLEDQPASIMMDGEVLFASSVDDLRRLEELKTNFIQNLNNEVLIRKKSAKYIDRAKAIYFGLQNQDNNLFYLDAVNIVETLLIAIAILNSTYLKKGLIRLESELDSMRIVPPGFREKYRKLIRTQNKGEAQRIVQELIVETESIWRSKTEQNSVSVDPSELTGFYEEFKSAYNKLMLACDEKNYQKAFYAAFMLDRETQSFLARFTESGTFPNIIKTVMENDFETVRANGIEHENQLIHLLEKNGIGIAVYRDSKEFKQRLLKKTS